MRFPKDASPGIEHRASTKGSTKSTTLKVRCEQIIKVVVTPVKSPRKIINPSTNENIHMGYDTIYYH